MVGAGPHGVAAAAALAEQVGGDAVTMVDPAVRPQGGSWQADVAGQGTVTAERIAVAVGLDRFRVPGLGGVALLDHPVRPHDGRVAVIGGGHTAASAACWLLSRGSRSTCSPGGLRQRATDVDPGWLGPKHLRAWTSLPVEARLPALLAARWGTTTPALRAWLPARVAPGLLRVVAERAIAVTGGVVTANRRTGLTPRVHEATGYRVDVARVGWLAPHVPHRLDGLPVLDRHLQAAPGLHLLGALAELELGPAGRNLWGAMRAAEHLLDTAGHG